MWRPGGGGAALWSEIGKEARVDEIIEGAEGSGVEGRDNKRAAEDQSDAGEFRAFRFT